MREQIIKEAIDDLEHGIEIGNIIFQMPEDEHIISILKQSLGNQLPMKPITHPVGDYSNLYYCKKCDSTVSKIDNYCKICGQKIGWI